MQTVMTNSFVFPEKICQLEHNLSV